MFIELLDQLRCPRPHEASWLVLAAHRTEHRDILEGVLGCPVCQAEYPIVDGIVRFAELAVATPMSVADEEEALRLAATLNLAGPKGYAVLVGEWAAQAPALHAMTEVQLMLVNPPAGLEMGWGLSGVTIQPDWVNLPLASSSARAIALDDVATAAQVAGAVETLSGGGRLLAAASLPLPSEVSEVARDGRHWVAERSQPGNRSKIVNLTRRK